MRHVWILTFVVVLYAVANGMVCVAAPQACLKENLGSGTLGLQGAAGALGYAVGCLVFGSLFRRAPGKYVLLGGVSATLLSILGLAASRTTPAFAASQFGIGLSGGAVWPFASAWLLDFQSEGIARTRLLRHYNLAWTNGSALGLFLTGLLCAKKLILESMLAGAALLGVVFVLAWIPRTTQPAAADDGPSAAKGRPARVGLPLLLAAIAANVVSVATRSLTANNYPELNAFLGFEADRMGFFTALPVLVQMLAFGFGSVYEPWLGLRRIYVFMAAALAAILLTFAYAASLFPLLAAAALSGLVSALAFQGSIVAATGRFAASPRLGTTLHEAMIGVGGVSSLAAGGFVSALKDRGAAPLDALRAPYLVLAGIAVASLAGQVLLVSRRGGSRNLLPPASSEP